ncbi:MAG: glycoside hydrolase family 97 N-terminal domain-containing protein, partial [Arenimonas sp.]|nr:glycoside hydrolase family 97 N-terminal domain-containing protein [Arenimonas sp.]
MLRTACAALFVFALSLPAQAKPETVARVDSPGKVLSVEVALDEGRASYRVLRFGEEVIAPSRLGFLLRNAGKFERNLVLASQSSRDHDETWEQPWGESRFVRDH